LETYPEFEDPEACRAVLDKYEQLRLELVEARDQGIQIPSAQYPPKKVEKFLELQLKALAAQVFLPGQDSAKRTAKRHELRTQCLAVLDGVQADMKKNKGGWWIFPNPLAIAEWIF
jgi:hypothetical protein